VFLFIHTNSSVDVSKIRPRISGQTSIKSARSGPQDLPSLSNVVFPVGRGKANRISRSLNKKKVILKEKKYLKNVKQN
jgi:hypothetical protein